MRKEQMPVQKCTTTANLRPFSFVFLHFLDFINKTKEAGFLSALTSTFKRPPSSDRLPNPMN